jgi:IS30 family transposase
LSYTHLTLGERKYLQQLLSEGLSIRKIAAVLDRSPSTISREIKRNKPKFKPHKKCENSYWYNHWRAQNLYIRRRREQHRRTLVPGSPEWEYIIEGLNKFWSPEAICGRWREEHPERKPLHFSTIYRYISRKEFPGIKKESHLRRRGKRLQTRNANYNSIQPDRTIPEWTDEIRSRIRLGDWEGDTLYGGIGKGLIVTLVDRKSRFLKIGLLEKRVAERTRLVMEKLLKGLPVSSISLDNGSEFSEFHKLEENLNTMVYFAEPHKPWQRGTNENTNDIIRFFFPKGFDFRKVTDEDISIVEDLINDRPKKCLNWKTPREVFLQKSVALD